MTGAETGTASLQTAGQPDLSSEAFEEIRRAALQDSQLEPATGVVQMDIGLHARDVHIHPNLTVLAARAFHLSLVARTLDHCDIPYFLIPNLEARASAVGVSEAHRSAATKALVRLLSYEFGYIAQLVPQPRTGTPPRPGGRAGSWKRLESAGVVSLQWYRCDPTQQLVLGAHESCAIEFWEENDDGTLRAPRHNRAVRTVAAGAAPVLISPHRTTALAPARLHQRGSLRSLDDLVAVRPDDIEFPIDVVYTWVDGSDPSWLQRRAEARGGTYHGEASSAARFLNRDELRYSLRSLHANAPWINKIWVVTDNQRPAWLLEDDRLTVVDHRDIFANADALPTFNSHAIESQLHHIKGLSEHFIYFNDDMFLGTPVTPQSFFTSFGLTRVFYSDSRVSMGPISEQDTPVDAAAKNNRELLYREFGRVITQTFRHAPYSLRRSILYEIEERFAEAHRRTAHSKIRSTSDISITSSLHQYYAIFTGRAVPSNIRYSYTQLAVPDLAARLERLLARRDTAAICLNDAYSLDSEIEGQTAILSPFLEAYFPVRSPWECS